MVLDNVLDEQEEPYSKLGQKVRKASDIERLFRDANLTVYVKSAKYSLHDGFEKVQLWMLC